MPRNAKDHAQAPFAPCSMRPQLISRPFLHPPDVKAVALRRCQDGEQEKEGVIEKRGKRQRFERQRAASTNNDALGNGNGDENR